MENGNHPTVTRECANPTCRREFAVQTGGQKAGSSPAVHVERIDQTPKGYCSTSCLCNAKGWQNPMEEWFSSLGMKYEEIFTPNYLAPSRRINIEGGDE